ncbi:MAG: DUF302 domain-containing protein [Calditrichales bacterium]|nr:MAG: DUF302 domain-containing protein [Calditrichales bacterium]
MTYSYRKEVEMSFEQALERVTEELQKEGFGVLTEIDVQATLKKKLNVDRKKYMILGACNPPLAHKALQSDPEIGVLLPCNVLVYETEDGKIIVSAVDAQVMFQVVGDERVQPIAAEVNNRLKTVINNI